MKILILNYEYPPLGGGAGVGSKAIAEELSKRGHSITVLTTHVHSLKKTEVLNNVNIHRVKVLGRTKLHGASWISLLTWPLPSIFRGIQLCKKNKYDLIFTNFFAPTGPTGLILSKLFNIPNIIYAHGGDVYDPEKMHTTPSGKGLVSALLQISMKIQAKSSMLMTQTNDLAIRIKGLLSKNTQIKVIPLPFDPPDNLKIKQNFSNTGLKLVSLGRVVSRKGFQYLIRALKVLPKDITFTLIGDGKYLLEIKKFVGELNLEDRVTFTGFISSDKSEKKFKILREADLFVLPSEYEAMGIVLQEAMAVGLPIISTNYGGQSDIIKDKINGLLIEPKNIEALELAILEFYNQRSLLSKVGENNTESVKQFYPTKLVDLYEQFFQQVINLDNNKPEKYEK